MEPNLPQGAGYAIIIGLGVFFAVLMNVITWIQNRFTKTHSDNVDEFTAASRNVPFGLICCGIVSSWTWSLTLLQSATQSTLGISGPYYYGLGGLCQVGVFSIIAAKVKANANLVTTFPEMGYFRYGVPGHLAFLWCAFVCNSIVSACILLGGSSVVHAVSGVNAYAAIWLLPFVCAIYVFLGGLRATFIADATHTFILLIFIMVFAYEVYAGDDSKIGSPGKMVELLTQAATINPVDGNYHGSYLTFRSKEGAVFGVRSVITGFGLVNCDQAYWSRAIASKNSHTSSAYFFSALAWFIIPVTMGFTLGLGARAMVVYPDFPSLSKAEIGAGLSAVASAQYLLGKVGSTLILLMVFLSVTSSLSGELIASSTLMSYDVYKRYIRPQAKPQEVVISAKVSVFIWSIYSSLLASIFQVVGISMGWLFNFLGVATASGVFPIALSFLWKDLNVIGAVGGSIGGMLLALVVWIATCKGLKGDVNVTTLSDDWVSFAGNAAAIVLGGLIAVGASLIKPDGFDFDKTRNKTALADHLVGVKPELTEEATETQQDKEDDTKDPVNVELSSNESNYDSELGLPQKESLDQEQLQRQYNKFSILTLVLALVFSFVIPVPLSAAPYIFSKGFLTGVVVIMYIWLFASFALVIVYPLVEARQTIWRITKLIFGGKNNSTPAVQEPVASEQASN